MSTMSRGSDSIETVLPTGSSEATIIVSVRNVERPIPESTPISSTFTRGTAGVAEGLAEADGGADAEPSGSMAKSGSSEATGAADASGTQAPPESTGSNTWAAAWRASTVSPNTTIEGTTTIATATTAATMVWVVARMGTIRATAASAPSRQASSSAWRSSSVPSTPGSNSRAAIAVGP